MGSLKLLLGKGGLLRPVLLLNQHKGVTSFGLTTSTSSRGGTKDKQLPLKMPDSFADKRLNSYSLFVKDAINTTDKTLWKGPGGVTNVSKEVALKWKALSEQQKKQYQGKAKQHNQAQEDQFAKLSAKEQQTVVDEAKQKTRKKLLFRKHKLADEHDKPKHPMGSFFLFLADFRQTQPKVEGPKDIRMNALRGIATRGGQEWKAMSAADKKPYVDRAARASASYKVEKEAWTKKMLKEGNEDVLKKLMPSAVKKPVKKVRASRAGVKKGRVTKKASSIGQKRGARIVKAATAKKTSTAGKKTTGKKATAKKAPTKPKSTV